MSEPDEESGREPEEAVVACQLDEAGKERRRGGQVHETLAAAVREVEERTDGYEFVFAGRDEVLDAVSTFLQRETDCCPFARFTVEVSPGLEEVRLLFAGPEGTKALLEEGLFEDDRLAAARE